MRNAIGRAPAAKNIHFWGFLQASELSLFPRVFGTGWLLIHYGESAPDVPTRQLVHRVLLLVVIAVAIVLWLRFH